MTKYVVLKQFVDGSPGWVQDGTVEARTARAAVRAHIDVDNEDFPGLYVAVPAISFRPISVKVETRTRLTLT